VTARKKITYIKEEDNNKKEDIHTNFTFQFEGERLGGGGGNSSPFVSDVEPRVKLLSAKKL
jgi:hypothetical protein